MTCRFNGGRDRMLIIPPHLHLERFVVIVCVRFAADGGIDPFDGIIDGMVPVD